MELEKAEKLLELEKRQDQENQKQIQEDEVADIFQAPLDLVLNISSYKKSKVEFKGKKSTILELQYEDYRIWGATAAILFNLAQKVSQKSI